MSARGFAAILLPVALIVPACQRREAPEAAGRLQPPAARRAPVTDSYHGVKVTDDYRWLEDWNDPAVRVWSDAENNHARSVLDNLPSRNEVRARLTDLELKASVDYFALVRRNGLFFALKSQPP